jgi:hypothetical protein
VNQGLPARPYHCSYPFQLPARGFHTRFSGPQVAELPKGQAVQIEGGLQSQWDDWKPEFLNGRPSSAPSRRASMRWRNSSRESRLHAEGLREP